MKNAGLLVAGILGVGTIALIAKQANAAPKGDEPITLDTYEERKQYALNCTTDWQFIASVAEEAQRRGETEWAAMLGAGAGRIKDMSPTEIADLQREIAANARCGQTPTGPQ